MSAPEHREEAQRHARVAAAERAQVHRGSAQMGPAPFGEAAGGFQARVYDPSPKHLAAADRELRASAEHLAAARSLELFEDARCEALPKAERAACPLLASAVARVHETSGGLLLELKPGIDAVATHRRLDCHLAYAIAQGFARPSCPLFLKGMVIGLVLSDTGRVISLTAEDPSVADQLRKQARALFLGNNP